MTTKELESGLKKFEIIAPLLSDGLEAAQKRRLKHEIMERHNVAPRTLRRYVQQYREGGYAALARNDRKDKGKSKAIGDGLLAEAVALRRELPGRSAGRIIEILEAEGLAEKGRLAKSTLTRLLSKAGASRGDVKEGLPARRFQKEGRNALWQADIKYGPYVSTVGGRKARAYLMAILDDATRMPMHAEFYDNQKLPVLEDAFRKALLKFGVPGAVYIDNGKIFVSKWFRLACARLGTRHIVTKPYSPQSKGKIERFNGMVNGFLEELSLCPPDCLVGLNKKFRAWLEEGYDHRPHSGLGGKTPYEAYRENPKRVRHVSSGECRQLFLWEETRKVDKTGAVKLKGSVYDAGVDLINKKADLRFDPFDLSVVEVWLGGVFVRKASRLVIGESLPRRQKPQTGPATANGSRLLDTYSNMHDIRDRQRNGAISFVGMMEGGGTDV